MAPAHDVNSDALSHPGVTPATDASGEDGLPHESIESAAIYDVESSDPGSMLVDRSGVAPEDVAQIGELMNALGELREAELRLSEASRRYMRLNDSDMRALHYLIVCSHRGVIATPGGIAQHLGISSASTTKLLDRLEKGRHILRAPHPTDRRALAISVTQSTHHAAMQTVGKQQAKRFYAAARLTAEERSVVIRFLQDMTNEITLRDEAWAREGEAESEADD